MSLTVPIDQTHAPAAPPDTSAQATDLLRARILECVPEVVYATDADGRWTYLNPAWTRLTGFTIEETLGRPFLDYVLPDHREGNAAQFAAFLAGEGAYCRHELPYRTKDGGHRWVEVHAHAERDAQGRLTGTYGSLADITAKRRNELLSAGEQAVLSAIVGGGALRDVLAEACHVYERVSEGSRCSILILDGAGTRLRHGAGPSLPAEYMAAIDGLEIGPRIGSCGTAAATGDLVIASDIETDLRWTGYRNLALAHGLRSCWSMPVVAKGGTVLGTFAVYRGEAHVPDADEIDASARLARLAAVAIERTRAIEALRRREEQLSEAQRIARTGDWLWHVKTGVLEWSDEVFRIFGVDRESFAPTLEGVLARVHPEDRDPLLMALGRSLVDGGSCEIEYRILRPDGEEHHLWAEWKRAMTEEGDVAHVFGVCRDITEQRRAEASLWAAKEAAEAASRTKSQFLANMSHELRTPLNAIIGFSDLMRSETFGRHSNPVYREYADDIHRSGEHLLDLINDILDMARIDAGRLELKLEPVALGDVIQEALRLARGSVEGVRHAVAVRLPTPGPVVRADRRCLKQVLINLLGNAVKFTPDGGEIAVTVTQGPGSIAIVVSDTGIGIPAERIADLGRPFAQVDNTMTRRNHGSGLGLSIAKSLVEAHGGRLHIESRVGTGTAVTVTLPLPRPHAAEPCADGQPAT